MIFAQMVLLSFDISDHELIPQTGHKLTILDLAKCLLAVIFILMIQWGHKISQVCLDMHNSGMNRSLLFI